MIAARSGAKSVVAVEQDSQMASIASSIFARNNFHQIHLVNKKSTDLLVGTDLPRKVDILVSEVFDR
jgi:type III protein arginine methyltransferase